MCSGSSTTTSGRRTTESIVQANVHWAIWPNIYWNRNKMHSSKLWYNTKQYNIRSMRFIASISTATHSLRVATASHRYASVSEWLVRWGWLIISFITFSCSWNANSLMFVFFISDDVVKGTRQQHTNTSTNTHTNTQTHAHVLMFICTDITHADINGWMAIKCIIKAMRMCNFW